MRSTGRLYAFDVNEKRLAGLTPRMRRAGLSNVYPMAIRDEKDNRIKRLRGKFDKVLIDAPARARGHCGAIRILSGVCHLKNLHASTVCSTRFLKKRQNL